MKSSTTKKVATQEHKVTVLEFCQKII